MKSISPRRTASLAVSPLAGSTYRMSVNPSVRRYSSATYAGAPQIGVPLNKRTEVVSSAPSPASSRRECTRFAATASEAVDRNRRREYIIAAEPLRSRPQLAFELFAYRAAADRQARFQKISALDHRVPPSSPLHVFSSRLTSF